MSNQDPKVIYMHLYILTYLYNKVKNSKPNAVNRTKGSLGVGRLIFSTFKIEVVRIYQLLFNMLHHVKNQDRCMSKTNQAP